MNGLYMESVVAKHYSFAPALRCRGGGWIHIILLVK